MSAGHAPRLSQLVRAATPDPIEAEKTSLREKFVAASAALVAEAKCLPDDKEELWEEKVMWMRRWEQRTGEVFPLVERGRVLGINTKIDTADGPAVAEADEAYERWVSEEIARGRANEDVQMEEAVTQAVVEQGTSAEVPATTEKMSHIEVVSRPVRKRSRQMVVESEDEDESKINVPPGSILHKPHMQWLCADEAKVREVDEGRGEESAGGDIAQASKTTKAGPSKRTVDDDDEVEVVESHTRAKGKAPVRSRLDAKVAADLSQSLRLLRAEATESQAAYLHLQVRVDQLAKALEKIGVE
ncbi:hypothetical protein M404DRAFT_34368 [Pisolithus tinctorius Marx 270]|uniref:Uncharacterized protein n=1 Tax=Pisolithus tinctorius Marx 270 TaxID=870435 RepID=A0A0C3N285_PISTI|nr:hypothetical protein M404DRAFT_34368 [Pisolithus tinctorius Marx 270]